MLKWQCECLLVKVVQLVVGIQLRRKVKNTSLVNSGKPLLKRDGDKLGVGERHTLLILCLRYTVFGDRPWAGERDTILIGSCFLNSTCVINGRGEY